MGFLLMTGITVGDRVRECRRSRKWSQAELAKKANISQVTISHVENNLSDQSKFLPQLASALGVSSEYLLSGKEYIEKSKGNLEDFIVIGGKKSGDTPTIENEQVLLVDTSEKIIKSSKIYFLCIDGEHYIKRLINMITHWVVRSDNPDKNQYPDIEISSSNMNLIQIEGRVVWRGGSL